ncbi:DUF5610 domain-containing protein [Shewanella avicenniae]|uniref:DUF5610 domain-containing protein n=1 Tax=Shewanella avicenniae TaxID=2814294 RepID=A0ABX7QPG0_9GAMM|nr:DUF5610 domain-containing protein [Shewanella avicenniae]QSX32902.1 DUF5610 domain-containing protein [Shewanella avicenniae]
MEVQNHGYQVSQVAKDKSATVDGNHGKAVSEVASSKSIRAQSRDYMNSAVLAAQEDVALSSGNQPLALLYRTALEAINEELAPALGDNAIQTIANSDVDYSPEATAGRIVDFATQFFSVYQQQNQQLSFEEQLSNFMGIIGGAIDKGFGEARDILDKLNVLDGDIADGVNATYDFVQQGLDKFQQNLLQPTDETATDITE